MDHASVLDAAREIFLARGRIEVGELAALVGVNRSTLYRRFNGRDGLLADVIWTMAENALVTAEGRVDGVGAGRIADLLGEFAAIANRDAAFRSFLEREPERALKMMSTVGGGVQPRIVAWVQRRLDAEVAAGTLTAPLPIVDLALILVRITETFVYANVITGEEPDAEKVRQACATMLTGPAE